MACLSTTLKYMVLLFNLLFFFLGCAIIGLGIYMQIKMAAYFDLLGNITITSATILIILGAIVTIISFFGCCGAIMENSCMMYTFGTLVTLILLVEVGLTVVVVIYKNEVKDELEKQLKEGLKNYNSTEGPHGGIAATWDILQQNYQCCGVENYEDWKESVFEKNHPDSVPDSCCRSESLNCGKDKLKQRKGRIYTDGCFEKFASDIKTRVDLTGAIGGILGAIQLIAILVSCCLGRKMANRPYEDYDHSPSAPLYATY